MEQRNRGGNGAVCEAIKSHFDILQYIQASYPNYHFKEHTAGSFQCVEHNSLCVTPEKGLFIWYSQGAQGSVIDFVMFRDGIPFLEAVSKLRLEMGGTPQQFSPERYQAFAKKEHIMRLPPAVTGKYSRVFAYLTKTRGIDGAVVASVVRRKMLYEDAKYHNCVFVGFGDTEKPTYASIRSTGQKKTVMDLPGSKKTGWFVNHNSPSLFVAEAPIDVLSIMTLLKLGRKDYEAYSYLAQGGSGAVSVLPLCLRQNPGINRIYLCYDNDDAGRVATKEARRLLKESNFKGMVIDKVPLQNDFNDDLKAHRAQAASIKIQQTQEVSCHAING